MVYCCHERPASPIGHGRARFAFSLIELLVVTSILGVVLAILLPALGAVRSGAKRIVCAANLRSVVSDFNAFADGTHPMGRGDSEALGQGRFKINDFQDLLYRLDEFWDQGPARTATLSSDKDAMMCPSGASKLTRHIAQPCGREAISPLEDVSVALNMRLLRPVVSFRGKNILAPTAASWVSPHILRHPYVPLAIDVDGAELVERGVDPFYVAPKANGTDDPYSSGRYWDQSTRHGRLVNVGFVGGHVLSSEHPDEERWDWSYQAEYRK